MNKRIAHSEFGGVYWADRKDGYTERTAVDAFIERWVYPDGNVQMRVVDRSTGDVIRDDRWFGINSLGK